MPLEGIRAWIGEVERKLGMRTRVFLVLTAIAIGGAGAAAYLALDTREDAVSEGDVRALQERLEERIATGGTGSSAVSALEAKVQALEAEVDELRDGGTGGQGASGSGGSEGGSDLGGSGGTGGSGTAEQPPTGAGSAGVDTKAEAEAKLRELAEEAEAEQRGGVAP